MPEVFQKVPSSRVECISHIQCHRTSQGILLSSAAPATCVNASTIAFLLTKPNCFVGLLSPTSSFNSLDLSKCSNSLDVANRKHEAIFITAGRVLPQFGQKDYCCPLPLLWEVVCSGQPVVYIEEILRMATVEPLQRLERGFILA